MSLARSTSALRMAMLIALGAFAVHQLRYLTGLGHGGAEQHSYLDFALPVLIVLAASSVVGATVAALSTGSSPSRSPGWGACTAALLAIFCAQEAAEGILPFAHGGWTAVPFAVLLGRVVSLLLAAVRSVERRFTAARRRSRPPAVVGRWRPCRARTLAREPLAFGLARRPPPLAVA